MSYTIDTLRHVRETQAESELFLLMGADSLADFSHWREPAEICALATPLVVSRAGEPAPTFAHLQEFVSDERLAQIAQHEVAMPATPISSTKIRELIASHGPWQPMVPPEVADYIRRHKLYL
jgi:nicotinate-nucleotide adenylyltransferase